MNFLKSSYLIIVGVAIGATVLYVGALSIPTNIDNAIQTIKTIYISTDGVSTGNATGVIITLTSDPASATKIRVIGNMEVGDRSGSVVGLWSSVAGGSKNTLSGEKSNIGGGNMNTVKADYSSVVGGDTNIIATCSGCAPSSYSVIAGGRLNTITGSSSTIAGGQSNNISGDYSFAAGYFNKVKHNGVFMWSDFGSWSDAGADFQSVNAYTFLIRAKNGVGIGNNNPNVNGLMLRVWDTVNSTGKIGASAYCDENGTSCVDANNLGGSAGYREKVGANIYGTGFTGNVGIGTTTPDSKLQVVGNFIAGADGQSIVGTNSSIAGGIGNVISGTNYSFIGGGESNSILFDPSLLNPSSRSFIGGGNGNAIYSFSPYSTIGGGKNNNIYNLARYSTIGGGSGNSIHTGAERSTIGGGVNNSINNGSSDSTIPGGSSNSINGDYSFAAGRNAVANADRTFVWNGHATASFTGSTAGSFVVNAPAGVAIGTGIPLSMNSLRVWDGTNGKVGAKEYCDENGTSCIDANNLGGVPGGPTGAVQFKYGSNFSGTSNLVWSGGKLGIGTTSPTEALTVVGGAQIDGTTFNVDEVNNSVSIGIASGSGTLHIASPNVSNTPRGDIILSRYWLNSTNTRASSIFHYYNTTTSNDTLMFGVAGGGGSFSQPNQISQAKMVIQANGNVGIGTSSPGAALHVSGGDIRWGNNSQLGGDQGGNIELGSNNSTAGIGIPYIDFHYNGLTSDFNARIINDANGRLSISASTLYADGNVGIGTTTPDVTLQVSGNLMVGADNQTINGNYSSIAGGYSNDISTDYGFIGGGNNNSVTSSYSSVGGGINNNILSATISTIGGGSGNNIYTGTFGGTIGGGRENNLLANYSTIGGGQGNEITFTADSTIGGGYYNNIDAYYSTIGGGRTNNVYIGADYSTIGGGRTNNVYTEADYGTIGGGQGNNIYTGSFWSTIGGGASNYIYSGSVGSTIPGGVSNSISGDYSFAAGKNAFANANNVFVWNGNASSSFTGTTNGSFVVSAPGGVGINTNNPGGYALNVSGNVLATAYYYSSDLSLKNNLTVIKDPLDKILALNGYNFTWKSNKQKSVGIIAQEVEKVFPELVSTDDGGFKSVMYGNLVAPIIEAIKALYVKYVDQQKTLVLLEGEIDYLEARVAKLEQLTALKAGQINDK